MVIRDGKKGHRIGVPQLGAVLRPWVNAGQIVAARDRQVVILVSRSADRPGHFTGGREAQHLIRPPNAVVKFRSRPRLEFQRRRLPGHAGCQSLAFAYHGLRRLGWRTHDGHVDLEFGRLGRLAEHTDPYADAVVGVYGQLAVRFRIEPTIGDHPLWGGHDFVTVDGEGDAPVVDIVIDDDVVNLAVAFHSAQLDGLFEHAHWRGGSLADSPDPFALAGVVDRASLDLEPPGLPLGVLGLDDEVEIGIGRVCLGAFAEEVHFRHLRLRSRAGCPHYGGAD